MKRILLVKTSSMGDVIHNLPVIADLRAQYPTAVVDWLVEESFADIPALHPGVNEVIPLAIRRWRKALLQADTWREIRALKQRLAQTPYDCVIDTQGLLKSAIFARLAHGLTCGYDRYSAREPLASYCYQQRFAVARDLHAVTRNRALVAKSLHYVVPGNLPDYGLKPGSDFPALKALSKPAIMALHGTSRDSKLWPVTHWVALGQALETMGFHLLLPWASQAEHQRALAIQSALRLAMVLPKLGLAEMAAVMHQATAAVGVDTGLSHLAAALNLPTIAIYTDTNPALTGVMAGGLSRAVNLGGAGEVPPAATVIAQLKTLLTPI